ncbi:hypothetical protein POTOM_035928 [Populus tomentosa]|uniref:Uncharacterized protein n=1 Tax=Populus tomentosa TaxID=118781 RepID=A0A8X7YZT3_POPTO|nr:hypothetical protein POTOM_035928 [Populus tomentosa]
MEVPVLTSFHSVSLSSKTALYMDRCSFFRKRLNCKRRFRLRIKVSSEKDDDDGSLSFKSDAINVCGGGQSGDLVDVISIGSRKDAVVDFCFDSPLQLSSSLLRFWNIQTKDSVNVQLQERVLEKDVNPRVMEVSQFLKFPSKAIVLVASAGYGLDHITAIDILKTRRFRNGFTVAIFLKPFSFEGQRRQDEVKDLVGKLQEYTNFCIDIDTDALLKKDLVTLDEALKSANSAVLLAINAISILISETHQKIIDAVHNNVKELKVSEVIKILESYKEAKIGFGTGNSIRSSITQALYDCPFIGAGVKELNGIVICIIASSVLMDDKDVHASLLTFRRTANYTGEIIICTSHEPNLEPNMLVTTVVIVG